MDTKKKKKKISPYMVFSTIVIILLAITPGFHMITVRLLSKVLSQCKLAVRTLCPLKHNTRIVII